MIPYILRHLVFRIMISKERLKNNEKIKKEETINVAVFVERRKVSSIFMSGRPAGSFS